MPFTRSLAPEFIAALNDLRRPGTWWQRLVDTPDVFLAIRNNSLNAYSGGGSIARIAWDGTGIGVHVHEEYLALASDRPYVNLCVSTAPAVARRISTVEEFAASLDRVRQRAALFSGRERLGENRIASGNSCVIDMEAAFSMANDDANPELAYAEMTGCGRVDLVSVSEDRRLVLVEAKLYSNSDLRSTTFPAVCDQLAEYHAWLRDHGNEILAAYQQVVACYAALAGRFFEERRAASALAAVIADPQSLSIDPVPRLLVFDFDRRQANGLRAELGQTVHNGVASRINGFQPAHVRAVGSAANVECYHLA